MNVIIHIWVIVVIKYIPLLYEALIIVRKHFFIESLKPFLQNY